MPNICIVTADPDFRALCGKALPSAAVLSLCDTTMQDVLRIQPTVILFDLLHPAEWEDVRRLREEPKTRDVPLIVLTGWVWADSRSRRRARELQCTAILAKPCPLPSLVDALNRAAYDATSRDSATRATRGTVRTDT